MSAIAYPPGGGSSGILTTKGDLLTRSSSAEMRLPIGIDGQALLADSSGTGGMNWTTLPGAATQAQQEAAAVTTAYVTPLRQQYHPSAAKAWVRFNGTGTLAVNSSWNVDSVSDGGTGIYTVNFTEDFANTDYMPLVYTDLALGATPGTARTIELHTISAGSLTVRTHPINSATLEDHESVSVGCWGDHA